MGLLIRSTGEPPSLREVAKAIGVAPNTLTHRFGDRSGLLRAVVVAGFARLRQELKAAADEEDGPFAALLAIYHDYERFARDNPNLFSLMFGAHTLESHAEINDTRRETFAWMAQYIRAAQATGWRADIDAEALTGLLWVIGHGAAQLSVTGLLDLVLDPARRSALSDLCIEAAARPQRPGPAREHS